MVWMVKKSAWGKLTAQVSAQIVGSDTTTTLAVGQVGIINGINVGQRANPALGVPEILPTINFHAVNSDGITFAIARQTPFYTVTKPAKADIPATRRALTTNERLAQLGYE